MFDATEFLNQSYDEPNSTQTIPPPEGEFNATIRSLGTPREFERDGGKGMVLDINWALDDPDGKIEAVTNRKENTVRQSLFLDVVTDAQGNITGLDMKEGLNVALGRLRDAVGLNGQGFTFEKLIGRSAHVRVKRDPDRNDPNIVRAKVDGVTKVGESFGGGAAASSSSSRRRKSSDTA